MKNIRKIMLVTLIGVSGIFLANCGPNIGTKTILGGYVYDNVSGQKLTTYTMTIDLPSGTLDITNGGLSVVTQDPAATTAPADLGKYEVFSTDILTQDFTVHIVADGYIETFYTAAQLQTTGNSNLDNGAGGSSSSCPPQAVDKSQCKDLSPTAFLYNIPMIPTGSTIGTAGTIHVVDQNGAAVASARMVNTATAFDATAITYPGNNLPMIIGDNPTANYFMIGELTGDASGLISIPVDTLNRGIAYTFEIYADGYSVGTVAIGTADNGGSLGTSAIFTSTGLTVALTKENPTGEALALLAASNEQIINGATLPVVGVLSVTYTFNQAIAMNSDLLFNLSAGALWGFATADSDGDTIINGESLTGETFSATAMSNFITIAASGTALTVTIAPPAYTTPDLNDTITYNLTTLLSGIRIKAAADTQASPGSNFTSVNFANLTAQRRTLTYQQYSIY